jgi:hypothetical protein
VIEVHFASELRAQYGVYSLCCHKLLSFYESLSAACDIDDLISKFDNELKSSYCGDKYALAIETVVNHSLPKLATSYYSNVDVRNNLEAIREAILADKDDWDFCVPLAEFRDIGKGLAQDFYREGGRATNNDFASFWDPPLVFSNYLLSEVSQPRPISTLPGDGIHLPFTRNPPPPFYWHLSYPVLFFHEYVSHIYVPRIDDKRFEDGWLIYAIELFMQTRWAELCENYSLICAQKNAIWRIWLPQFDRLAKKGYEIACDVDACLGDNDKFLQITWDLASYPCDVVGSLSFHDDFLNLIKRFTRRDTRHLLSSAVETSTDALQLYDNLKRIKP